MEVDPTEHAHGNAAYMAAKRAGYEPDQECKLLWNRYYRMHRKAHRILRMRELEQSYRKDDQ